MQRKDFTIDIDLGEGRERAAILTCDLGVDYVKFNSEYSS